MAGQLMTTTGALLTVNEAEQLTGPSQEEVTVQVTVVEPPQAGGAPLALLEMAALQPPEKLTVVSQALYALSTSVWVWQAATV